MGLTAESDATVVLKQNAGRCSRSSEFELFRHEIDPTSGFVVQIPSTATELVPFARCRTLAFRSPSGRAQ